MPALSERPHGSVSGVGVAVSLNATLMVSGGNGPHPGRTWRGPIREHDVTYDLAVSEDVVVVAECLLEQQVCHGGSRNGSEKGPSELRCRPSRPILPRCGTRPQPYKNTAADVGEVR